MKSKEYYTSFENSGGLYIVIFIDLILLPILDSTN